MTLIDSLEYYYNRDDQGNLQTQDESEPLDEPFGELDDQHEDNDEEITEDDDAYGDPDYKEDKDE